MRHSPMLVGCGAEPASLTGCPPKLNGNMPRGQAHQQPTASAMTRASFVRTPDSLISTLVSFGLTLVAVASPPMDPFRLAASSPIHGGYSICMATPGNGSRIAGHPMRLRFRPMDPPSCAPRFANWVSFAAALLARPRAGQDPQFALPL